jgi:protein-L-isoaspartate(D-aspartate) O-methyltransferase
MNFDQARFNMVEQQIRTWHVLDPKVLEALQSLKRELFVPAEYQNLAYSDTEIPLSDDKVMPAPCIQARLVHDLHLTGTEKVLEIGSASGYTTALIGQLCARVIGIESDARLVQSAKLNLQNSNVTNADVRVGLHSEGCPAEGPFDAIILQGSVAQVPQSLLDQLQVNGRLIAVVGEDPMMQTCLIKRMGPSSFSHQNLWDTVVQRLQGIQEPSHFHF